MSSHNIQSLVFGLGHQARHGKDLVAQAIIEARGKEFDIRRYAFADELKREITVNALRAGGMEKLFDAGLRAPLGGYWNGVDIVPLPEWVQYDPTPDMSDPMSPLGKQRTLQQWWGTEYRRKIDPHYWLNKVAERISEEKPEIAIITDVRFNNEFLFCKEYGGVIKVYRPGLEPSDHISEKALANYKDKDWDAIILNNTTVEDLRDRAVNVFDDLMNKVR